jgi:PBP1b-binding outer membrane lipoprotein LpoB
MRRILLVLTGALLLAGCAMSPYVQQPQTYMQPGQYSPPPLQHLNASPTY